MFLKLLTVAALASFEVYAAIPAGIAFELNFLGIFLSSTVGGLFGVFVAAFLGDRIRKFISRYKKQKDTPTEEKPKTGIIYRIWNRFGIIGLGFLGTITVGAPISIAVGLGLKAPIRVLIIWCSIGVMMRCALFTAIGYYGFKLL
jgi:membrane protein YqaA with SNARE-associated domain